MSETVKPKRHYSSPRRSEQAAGTRAAVVDAAGEVFMRDGWQKATIAAIAERAGVSPETIYAGFRNKRALLDEAITAAVRGPAPDTPLMQQAGPRAVLEAADQKRQLALFTSDITRILERVAPMMAVLRTAAETEPALAAHYARLHRGRRENFERVVDALLRNGPLRVDRETAVASIARLTSPELYMLATRIEGVSAEQHARWLLAALTALLLP
jgi:AcrR family transcriptional regulator